MKVLFTLITLVCLGLISYGQSEIEDEAGDVSHEERVNAFLQSDPITLKIVEKFYYLGFPSELLNLMHLLLNNLLISR